MIKVSVMYPNGPDARFDMAYYLATHMPMVREKLGAALRGMHVEQGLGGADVGSTPAFVAMGHLMFESVDAFAAAFTPHADDILGDIPNYTNTQPVVQVSDIMM